jgi:hypothetical protein
MLRIPLTPDPSLTFSVTLGGQTCKVELAQRLTGVYMDLYVGDQPIVQGAVCLDRVRIVRYGYLGFVGDLAFIDTQGTNDPHFSGFGGRFTLVYLEAADL